MKKINIFELHQTINNKLQKKNDVFEKALDLCHRRIRLAAEYKMYNCFFQVPEVVLGYPMYDLNQCISFLMRELQNNGFEVKYYFPKFLYISWQIDKKENIKTKSMIHYKPSGKLELNII